ncbi:MAG TPA: TonB-dependent receptor [Bryobacteraceae bacterium]|nr:TonB-dependent receptor [Bryobacteraceae bacterium]
MALRCATLQLVLILSLASVCAAQVDRSSLNGTARDTSGRVIPGAAVRATQADTGLARITVTTGTGTYSLDNLPIGKYTVAFSKAGFQDLLYNGVEQAVGQARTLDPILQPAGRNEQVTVTSSTVELDQTAIGLGSVVEDEAIGNLPLNGRNWATLTALVAGAIDQGGSTQRSIRFAGRGRDDMNITFDGVDATGIANQAQKAFVRLAVPTESIAQFRVDTAQYTAEFGDAAGAQIAAASASGGNALHGSLFEYLRNSFFDARSPLDQTHGPLPFRLNQFGGAFSGPIVKNKTFFYFAYEGFRQVQDQTLIGFVPSAALRSTVLAGAPVLGPIVNAYPPGTGPTSNPNIAQHVGTGLASDHENSEMLRIDQHFTDKSTAYLRFNYDQAISSTPLGSLTDRQGAYAAPLNGVGEFSHVFSPMLVDEFKFGVNQAITHTANLTSLPYTVNVSGFSALNPASTSDQDGTTFSWLDNLSWTHGKNLIKAGAVVRRIQMNEGSSATGTLTYTTLADFTSNMLDSATQVDNLPLKRMRKTQEGGFIQDEYKVRPNLTLNAGLRYEYFSVFHEATGRALPFDFLTCGGFCAPNAPFYFPTRGGFDPRVGLAWSPAASHGKLVLRSGYGIYHEDGQLDDQNFPTANDQPSYSLIRGKQFPDLSYPIDPFLVNATGVLTPKDLYRHRKDMYAQDWSLSVQRSLGTSAVATVSYLGTKGTNVMNRSYTNLIDPATGLRPYPQFGRVEFRDNESNSSFNALQAAVQRRFAQGWLAGANYMWSHAINDASLGSGVEDVFPENVSCRACDRSSSDEDARHSFSAYTVYELPWGSGRRYLSTPGWRRMLFGGWDLDAVAGGRAGLPVNITVDRPSSAMPDGNNANQRPNYVPGVPLTPVGGSTPMRWINPAAFAVPAKGAWGDLGRNAFNGPALWQIDTALAKRFAITERTRLEFRGECFNLLNRAQYGNPLADISVPASFGRITTLVNTSPTGSGTPRQFQLALRLLF